MKKEKMSFFSKLKNSITRPEAYSHFLKESGGRAVLYLLFLCLIFGGIGTIKTIYEFNKVVSEVEALLKEKVPNFTLKNGELNVEGEMPIILNERGPSVVIIDTSDKADESILDKYQDGLFISKTKFIQKQGSYKRQETSFASFRGMTLTKTDVQGYVGYSIFLKVAIGILSPILFFISKFFSAFIITILALIVNGFYKAKVTFGQIYKLSIYALTLPIIIKVFFTVTTLYFGFFWVVYYGVALLYLILALKSINKNQQEIGEPITN